MGAMLGLNWHRNVLCAQLYVLPRMKTQAEQRETMVGSCLLGNVMVSVI